MQMTRESIFVGAVRSFCVAFAGLLGVFVAIVLGVIIYSMLSATNVISATTETHIAPDANGKRSLLPLSAPVILRINIDDVIGGRTVTASGVKDILLDSRENLLSNDRVKGILLHFDTPGGTVDAADDIYRLLLAYKQKYHVPIYGYVDGICASGGVYIASACDKVFSSPTSIIGSVGVVFGPHFNVAETMEKVGVKSITISEGKDKDMLSPFRPWIPGEDDSFRKITATLYQRFVDVVSAARPGLDKQKLVDTYGAQVYLAEEAQELGFIDNGNSSYEETLTALALSCGIQENQSYQVLELQKPEKLFEQLFEGNAGLLSGKITHRVEIGHQMGSDMSGKFLYLYQP